jgi:hypothetical protein
MAIRALSIQAGSTTILIFHAHDLGQADRNVM